MYKTKIKFNQELEIHNIIYLKIKAQSATSGPPIGPIFGQCGIPAAPFCKEFNDRSSIFNTDVELYVNVYIYSDNSYDFDIDLPSNSYFVKKAAFRLTGYPKPGWVYSDLQILKKKNTIVHFKCLTPYILYEIFLYKKKHFGYSLDLGYSFCRKLKSSLKTIGLLLYEK